MHRAFKKQNENHRRIGTDLEQAPQPAAVLAAELRIGNVHASIAGRAPRSERHPRHRLLATPQG